MKIGFRVGGALILLILAACDESTPELRMRPRYRFVESTTEPHSAAAKGTAALPEATILDDTRFVLASHPSARLAARRALAVPRTGAATLTLELGDALPNAQRLLLAPTAGVPKLGWRTLEPVAVEVETRNGRRVAEWRAALPPSTRGRTIPVDIVAYQLPETGRTQHRTSEIEIPSGASLEFSIGVLEPTAAHGAVRFTVSACSDSRCEPLFRDDLDATKSGVAGWHDRRIPLSELAGLRRSFEFSTEDASSQGASGALPVWANPTLFEPQRDEEGRPNLLFISLDTVRADHLSAYGYARDTTPFLAAWSSAHGARFEKLIAAATHTGPSHMTMFTSLPPSVHGATHGLSGLDVPVLTLAEVLRTAGYETAAFTEDGPLAHRRGFGRGFNIYVENKGAERVATGQCETMLAQARAWFGAQRDKPFFVFLHTFQAHSPYTPPESHRQLFQTPSSAAESIRDIDRHAADYDREIRYLDDLLREFFSWLDEHGFIEDTIILVTSDHGEAFREHGFIGHMEAPYEELLRVPLFLSGPGVPRGIRIATPVTHGDLMPTLLDLVGVEAPPSVSSPGFAHLLAGASSDAEDPMRAIVSESWTGAEPDTPSSVALRSGDRKLLRYRRKGVERIELYDLAADPGEQQDLARSQPEELRRMSALLDAQHAQAAVRRRELEEAPSGAIGEDVILDATREEMMRALGYIE